MSESAFAKLARLHAELASVYRAMEGATGRPSKVVRPALRVRDVARMLNISDRAVRELRARGKMPPTLALENLVRWDAGDIERWLQEREPRNDRGAR